ncbi:MAG TPA: tetratricopeptide repeat protein, partial [Polyangiaceae bacterium]|nr:tetratricopeptide repeat protein [Polyangiaceae bacterium]
AAWTTPDTGESLVGASVTRPGGPVRGTGVSGPVAALLVLLAVAQGALFVLTYWWLTRTSPTTAANEASSAKSAAVQSAAPASSAPAAVLVPAAPSQSPTITPSEPAPVAEAPPPSAAPIQPLGVDESGVKAPTCEELLEGVAVPDGAFPGAAYEQQRHAEKSLVRGNVDEAQRAYCKAAHWQKSATRYIDLAQLMLIRRDGAQVAAWAKRALEVNPGNTKALGILGDGLARIGDIPGATKAWFEALGTPDPSPLQKQDFVQTSLQEAQLSMFKRDWPRAERFYRRVILVEPESLKAALGLAGSLLKLGDGKSSLRWAQRALVIDPRSAAARVALGDAQLALGQQNAAENEWREALGLDPNNGEARMRLAKAAKAK